MTEKYRKVILMGNAQRHGVLDVVKRLRPEIAHLFKITAEDFSGSNDLSSIPADFAIVFGGDGALLRAVHQLGRHQVPFLAVHLGTLGFLSSVSVEDLIPLLRSPVFFDLPIRRQILLECSIIRQKQNNDGTALHLKKLVVNEVALRGGPPFKILKIELFVDHESATVSHGDGLVISTPVGSTAHSLSAGGPILRKDLDDVVITPLNPHTLSNRPVVDSASRNYEMHVLNQEACVVIDGEICTFIQPGDRVLVDKAPFTFDMFRTPGRSFYRTLREKLGWSGHNEGMGYNR